MNNFNPKYIKISSEYLEEKLSSVKMKERKAEAQKNEDTKSSLTKFVNALFKS